MWKLWHKLFGWDYVHWKNSVSSGIARVHVAKDGSVFYWRYKSISCMDILYSPNQDSVIFTDIVWLTCPKDKYIHYEN